MTINGSNNIAMRDHLGHKIDKRYKRVWCTDNGKSWPNAVRCAEEIGVHVQNIRFVCNGRQKTCKGMHFSYEENVAETQQKMAKTISEMSSKQSELERKAALWDAYEAEQNSIRKAEEERATAIAKVKEKIERRDRIASRAYEDFLAKQQRLNDAKRELAELEANV